MTETSALVSVRRDDLELLLKVCACYAPYPLTDDISGPVDRVLAALRESECPECGFRPPTHTHDKDCPRYQSDAPEARTETTDA
jgi:hypothetical protein